MSNSVHAAIVGHDVVSKKSRNALQVILKFINKQ